MITIATYNFPANYSGDSFVFDTFQIQRNGVKVDLTGASLNIQFKQTPAGGTMLQLSSPTDIFFIDAGNGIIGINEKIINLPPATYCYELKIAFADGEMKTWAKGNWPILL